MTDTEESSTSTATQEPTEPIPVPPSTSEQVEVPPMAPEGPREAESAIPVTIDSSASSPKNGQIEPFTKLTLLAKAREMIQFRKRRKLEKIMGMFLKQASITNDEVEKLLHISDATATRYLSQLEKEGKIKQIGNVGKSVKYQKVL